MERDRIGHLGQSGDPGRTRQRAPVGTPPIVALAAACLTRSIKQLSGRRDEGPPTASGRGAQA